MSTGSIDGRPVWGVVRRQLLVDPTQIENCVDPANQVLSRHHLVEVELVEELALPIFPPTHHRRTPLTMPSARRNHGSHQFSMGVLQHIPPKIGRLSDQSRGRSRYLQKLGFGDFPVPTPTMATRITMSMDAADLERHALRLGLGPDYAPPLGREGSRPFCEHEVLPWRGVPRLVAVSDRLWRVAHPRIPLSYRRITFSPADRSAALVGASWGAAGRAPPRGISIADGFWAQLAA